MASNVKLFIVQISTFMYQARKFVTVCHLHCSLMSASKAGAYLRVGPTEIVVYESREHGWDKMLSLLYYIIGLIDFHGSYKNITCCWFTTL